MLGQVDDGLFPHRAAETVCQVVHLVHDHVPQAVQGGGVGVEHVAQHLGGHHDHGGFGVDARVAGQQAHVVLAVRAHEIVVLLVAQRLDRGRVERLHAAAQRQVDAELAHDGLTRARGGGHEDGAVRLHSGTRLTLKVVQREIQGGLKRAQGALGVCGAFAGCGVGGGVVGAGVPVRSGRSVCVRSVLCVVLSHGTSSVAAGLPALGSKRRLPADIRYGRTHG